MKQLIKSVIEGWNVDLACMWYSCSSIYVRKKAILLVHMDFSGVYPALNSMWMLRLFLSTWPHFHNFYFLCACAWVCSDPVRPSGSLIIRTLRPEYKNSFFWLRRLHGILWEATWAVSRSLSCRRMSVQTPFASPRDQCWIEISDTVFHTFADTVEQCLVLMFRNSNT